MNDTKKLTPAGYANAAAEAIRGLNHATNWHQGYEWPSDVDAVIGGLHELANRLMQSIEQADRWLTRAYEAGLIGHDEGGDVALSVELLSMALGTARADTGRLANSLDLARSESFHLTGL